MKVSTTRLTQADHEMKDNQVLQNQGQPRPLREMQARRTSTSKQTITPFEFD